MALGSVFGAVLGSPLRNCHSYGGSSYPAGLLSLWNAKTPTICPVGPQIQTSVAGNQPDADGNMVAWPVNHPGRGVQVYPSFTKLGNNSVFAGAVAGSPGTTPTGWTYTVVDSPTMAVTDVEGENKLTFSGTASRGYLSLTQAVAALAVYTFDVMVTTDGVLRYADLEYCSLTGGTIVVMKDGVVVADETAVPTAGTFKLSVKVTAGAVGDTAIFRFGLGASAVATGTVSVWQPQLVLGAYSLPYVRSTTGPVSVASTAATSLGIGGAIPLNARMTDCFQKSVTDGVEKCVNPTNISIAPWTPSNVTVNNATDFTFNAQYAALRQTITFLAGVQYKVTLRAKRITGNTNLAISVTNATTVGGLVGYHPIICTGEYQTFSVVCSIAAGGAVVVGMHDRNASGFGQASMTDVSVQRIQPSVFTLAVLCYMSAGSAEITTTSNILAARNAETGGIYMGNGGVLSFSDGTNTCTVTVADGWGRGEVLLISVWTNSAGTQMQIGYKKSTELTFTKGAAATYDGSVNPGTHLRFGYTVTSQRGYRQSQVWGKVATDLEVLSLLKYED